MTNIMGLINFGFFVQSWYLSLFGFFFFLMVDISRFGMNDTVHWWSTDLYSNPLFFCLLTTTSPPNKEFVVFRLD